MIGKHNVIVQNSRLQYKFVLNRNITILQGDSATGKSTLIDMVEQHQLYGQDSGINISCDKQCTVLSGVRWEENLAQIRDSIVFIDEGSSFIRSEDFARAIQGSDNYYVIASRQPLYNLPYSIREIYGIRNTTRKRYEGVRRLYSEFYPLTDKQNEVIEYPDLVIVEDSNSGFQFFSAIFEPQGIPCISARGKGHIHTAILEQDYENILVIADGAALGPEIDRILKLRRVKNVILYLPESFEWLVLKSDLLNDREVRTILETPEDYIESSKYISWERFFTDILVDHSNGKYLQYSKRQLNPVYLQPNETGAILSVMPEMILKKE